MVDVEGFRIAFQSQFQAKNPEQRTRRGPTCRNWIFGSRSKGKFSLTDDNLVLAPIEVVFLGNIVTVFVRGVKNNRVRSIVLVESMNNAGKRPSWNGLRNLKNIREEKRESDLPESHYVEEWS
ncbi:hypothetical protein GcM3_010030 [Golovinomyces cichoracearum]|uniref:Uncharacterized protein n=1 Tax=Golovinomyces cichoracearum TaxID=62708 RepID=A0A420JA77_9PEZI|nr:hypothetical protein GcM3_010030 [Golovinomyces cichoracearum]